jgi:5''-methylthioadenosine/S-adenosylhomocysteine nucleosidase
LNTIGIIGAMDEEVALLRETSEIIAAKNILGSDFYIAKNNGKNIVIVKCGIGKVNAAICAQVLIDHFAVDCIINIGVAGAIFKDLKIGDVVVSTDTVQHDVDTSVLGDPVGTIARMDESFFKADEKLIELAKIAGEQCTEHEVYTGRIASGDQFISSTEQKEKIWKLFGAYCAEMEGAAIGHACYLNKVPFVIIRSISDNADGEAGMSFSEFAKIAAVNSSKMVERLLSNI